MSGGGGPPSDQGLTSKKTREASADEKRVRIVEDRLGGINSRGAAAAGWLK